MSSKIKASAKDRLTQAEFDNTTQCLKSMGQNLIHRKTKAIHFHTHFFIALSFLYFVINKYSTIKKHLDFEYYTTCRNLTITRDYFGFTLVDKKLETTAHGFQRRSVWEGQTDRSLTSPDYLSKRLSSRQKKSRGESQKQNFNLLN